jgi:large subunit ribosomal protein L10
MAKPEKVAQLAEITDRFKEADATLLTEYRGLTVSDIAEVRGALRESGAEYKVMKNTLARIAVREVGLDELVEMLEGPTAVVFVKGDVVEAAKALDDAVKKYPVLVVKGGAMAGKVIDAEQAKALAKLESRETLLTKIAMLFNQPAQQTVNVFSALLRDLGSMLGQVVAKKESGELPGGEAPAAEAAPAEEPAAEAATPAAEPEAEAPAEPEAQTTGTDEVPADEPTPEAAEAEAEEPPEPETEEKDPAAEAADEASAGTADTDESK